MNNTAVKVVVVGGALLLLTPVVLPMLGLAGIAIGAGRIILPLAALGTVTGRVISSRQTESETN